MIKTKDIMMLDLLLLQLYHRMLVIETYHVLSLGYHKL